MTNFTPEFFYGNDQTQTSLKLPESAPDGALLLTPMSDGRLQLTAAIPELGRQPILGYPEEAYCVTFGANTWLKKGVCGSSIFASIYPALSSEGEDITYERLRGTVLFTCRGSGAKPNVEAFRTVSDALGTSSNMPENLTPSAGLWVRLCDDRYTCLKGHDQEHYDPAGEVYVSKHSFDIFLDCPSELRYHPHRLQPPREREQDVKERDDHHEENLAGYLANCSHRIPNPDPAHPPDSASASLA